MNAPAMQQALWSHPDMIGDESPWVWGHNMVPIGPEECLLLGGCESEDGLEISEKSSYILNKGTWSLFRALLVINILRLYWTELRHPFILLFLPADWSWKSIKLKGSDFPASYGTSCATTKNQILCFGGYRANGVITSRLVCVNKDTLECRVVKGKQWISGRAFATFSITGKEGYIFGGQTANGVVNELGIYSHGSFNLKTFPKDALIPLPRRGHSAAVVEKSQLVIYGGEGSDANIIKDPQELLWVYDTGKGSWERGDLQGPSPGPLVGHYASLEGGKLIFVGGQNHIMPNMSIFIGDWETKTWWPPISLRDSPNPRCFHAGCIFEDGTLVVQGGKDEDMVFCDLVSLRVGFYLRDNEVQDAVLPSRSLRQSSPIADDTAKVPPTQTKRHEEKEEKEVKQKETEETEVVQEQPEIGEHSLPAEEDLPADVPEEQPSKPADPPVVKRRNSNSKPSQNSAPAKKGSTKSAATAGESAKGKPAPSTQKEEKNSSSNSSNNNSNSNHSHHKDSSDTLTVTANSTIESFLWTSLPGCPSERDSHSMVAISKSEAFLFGGRQWVDGKTVALNDAYIFNVVTRTWRPVEVANPPSARYAHSLSIVGEEIIVFGGSNGEQDFNDIYVLHLGQEPLSWQSVRPRVSTPAAHRGRPASSRGGRPTTSGRGGGGGGKSSVSSVSSGKGSTNATAARGPVGPVARFAHATCVVGRKMYVFGGSTYVDSQFKKLKDFWCFDVDEEKWTQVRAAGDLPPSRCTHTCVALGENVVMFAGLSERKQLRELNVYSAKNNTWNRPVLKGRVPSERECHAAIASNSRQMLVFGGYNGEQLLQDLHAYDFAKNMWSNLTFKGMEVPARAFFSASLIGDHLVMFGGIDDTRKNFNDIYGFCFK
jgi:N-acetylneuraminic acid mutarotase